MLKGHIDQSFLHKCAKTQPTEIHISYVIDKYVLEKICPLNWGYGPNNDVFIWKIYKHVCATHEVTAMNLVTRRTVQIFDIYHSRIWLPHYTYVPLYCYCSVQIVPTSVHT